MDAEQVNSDTSMGAIGWRRYTHDILCVVTLCCATMLFLWPATVLGRDIVVADNLIQNLPLRELAGWLWWRGEVPLWNPYLWSGSPLLASFSAGVLYPLNFLFAVLPTGAAWNLVLIATYIIGSLGAFAFLRGMPLKPIPSLIGAMVFSFSGFMAAQLGHVDTINGAAWMPWILLSTRAICQSREWKWVWIGGICFALQILAGAPEIPVYTMLVVAGYLAFWLWTNSGHGIPTTFQVVVMIGTGLLMSMGQLLPGVFYALDSQRASISYKFFTSYSLPLSHLILLFIPYQLGGWTPLFPLEYFGRYELAELTGYCGLLTLSLALGTYGIKNRIREIAFWKWALPISLLLVLGGSTPLDRFLYHVPIYNKLRAQARNFLEFDFAAVVLAAFAVETLNEGTQVLRRFKWLLLLPSILVLGWYLSVFLNQPTVVKWVIPHWGALAKVTVDAVKPYLLYSGVIASLTLAVLLLSIRLRGAFVYLSIIGCLLLDLAIFDSNLYWVHPPRPTDWNYWGQQTRIASFLQTNLSEYGRFAIYDPGSRANSRTFRSVDLNVLWRRRSIQGYGALVDSSYERLTRTHQLYNLDASLFDSRSRTLDDLKLVYLMVPSVYFADQTKNTLREAAEAQIFSWQDESLHSGDVRTLYLGAARDVSRVNVVSYLNNSVAIRQGERIAIISLMRGQTALGQIELRAGAETSEWRYDDPKLRGGILHSRATIFSSFPLESASFRGHYYIARLPLSATGVDRIIVKDVLDSRKSGLVIKNVIPETGGYFISPDPVISYLMNPKSAEKWKHLGEIDDVKVYRNKTPMPSFWLERPFDGDRAIVQGQIRVIALGDQDQATLVVRTKFPALLVRSVAYSPGWSAIINGKPTSVLRVGGVVQGVLIHPGDSVVSFYYFPKGATVGLVLSMLSSLATLSCLIVETVRQKNTG